MSPAGVLFATFAVLMLLGSPITVALGVAAMAARHPGGHEHGQPVLRAVTRVE